MRRVGLFAAFLLLLGLTTATAASFDVQAEDIASFTVPVSIPIPGAPVPTGTELFLIDDGPHATLSRTEPTGPQGGNKTAKFIYRSTDLEIEQRTPTPNGDYYVVWSTGRVDEGMRFTNQTARVHFFRTSGAGELTAGLFECAVGAHPATISTDRCRLLGTGASTTEQLDIPLPDANVSPGSELRLKMVNLTATSSNIQWGYKQNNRPGRLEVLAGSGALP